MKLYHGSSRNFEKFKISEKLARHDIQTVLPEGLGVYMTKNIEVAKSYGKNVYVVEAKGILDFSKLSTIKKETHYFLSQFDYNDVLLNLFDTEESKITFEGVKFGEISIVKLIKELWMMHEELIYTKNYKFDLFDYFDELENNWDNFLKTGVIKYFQKGFNDFVYISKNESLIKIKEVK